MTEEKRGCEAPEKVKYPKKETHETIMGGSKIGYTRRKKGTKDARKPSDGEGSRTRGTLLGKTKKLEQKGE